MKTILKVIEKIDGALEIVERHLLYIIGGSLLSGIFVMVIFRYFLHMSLGWYSDLQTIFYMWLVMIGIAYVLRLKRHICFTVFVKQIKSDYSRTIVDIVALLPVLVFSIFQFIYGYKIMASAYELMIRSIYLFIPWYLITSVLPLTGLLLFWHSLRQISMKLGYLREL